MLADYLLLNFLVSITANDSDYPLLSLFVDILLQPNNRNVLVVSSHYEGIDRFEIFFLEHLYKSFNYFFFDFALALQYSPLLSNELLNQTFLQSFFSDDLCDGFDLFVVYDSS